MFDAGFRLKLLKKNRIQTLLFDDFEWSLDIFNHQFFILAVFVVFVLILNGNKVFYWDQKLTSSVKLSGLKSVWLSKSQVTFISPLIKLRCFKFEGTFGFASSYVLVRDVTTAGVLDFPFRRFERWTWPRFSWKIAILWTFAWRWLHKAWPCIEYSASSSVYQSCFYSLLW